MRITCSQCRNPFVVDEMSTADRITCPTCGAEIRARVGVVAEPPRPAAPPPRVMPVGPAAPPWIAAPRAAPPPVVRPLAPGPSRAPSRASSAPPAAASRAAVDASPRRSCPACGAKLAPVATRCDACGVNYQQALRVARGEPATDNPDSLGIEKSSMDGGVAAGIGAILIGVVWFWLGWQAGRIFFYPPVLVVMGVIGIANGLSRTRAVARRRSGERTRSRFD